MQLYELKNIRDEEEFSYRINCAKLVVGIVSEYAISYLQMNEKDIKVYPKIRDYYLNEEISTEDLLHIFARNMELGSLMKGFPSVTREEFNASEWNEFLQVNTWECDGTRNRYQFNNITFESKCLFLKQYRNENGTYILSYVRNDEEYLFVSWGNEYIQLVNPIPYFILQKKSIENEEKDIYFDITEEQFFNSSKTLQELDEEQRKAVRADTEKNLVILAGAGSGKTRTLLCRYAYLHVMKNIPLRKLLLITFTNEAASKLRGDGTKLLKEIYSIYKPDEVPAMEVSTIDALLKRTLDANWAYLGFSTAPVLKVGNHYEHEYYSIIERLIEENGLMNHYKRYKGTNYVFKNMEAYLSGVQGHVIDYDLLIQLFIEYQKKNNRIYNFIYINEIIRTAMSEQDSWLKALFMHTYDAVLIDEFQDINRLQNATFQYLYQEKMHFTFVGDDDQSIYEWRGADSDIIKRIAKQKNTEEICLTMNYRNNPNIVNAGNYILDKIEDRAKVGRKIIANRKSGSKIRVTACDNEYRNLINEIQKLLQLGKKAESICILCRSRDSKEEVSSKTIAEKLREAGIEVRKENIQPKINDRYRIFKSIVYILSDYDLPYAYKMISKVFHCNNYTEKMIGKIVRGDVKVPEDLLEEPEELAKALEDLIELQSIANNIRLCQSDSLATLVSHYALYLKERNEDMEEEEVEVLELFEEYCREISVPWPVEQRRLKSVFYRFENQKSRTKEQNMGKGVRVTTIHAAKGLEAEIVFIMGLDRDKFPNTERIKRNYNEQCRQIEDLKQSRISYYELKKQITNETLQNMRKECADELFQKNLSQPFGIMCNKLKSFQRDIAGLTPDGVEIYLETYKNHIAAIQKRYDDQKNKIAMEKLKYQSFKEDVEEQIEHLKEYEQQFDEVPLEQMIETDRLKDLQEQKEKLCIKIENTKKTLVMHERRVQTYQEHILNLSLHYQRCLQAKAYLSDMQKEQQAEKIKKDLELQKKRKINEERRNYYVAFTRAIEILYLCYSKNSTMSEFITCIPEKYRKDYLVLTRTEQKEMERLHNDIVSRMYRDEQDDMIDRQIQSLVSEEKYKRATQNMYEEYLREHPVFNKLPLHAKVYFEKAMRIMYLSNMIDIPMETEFAHNIQRMAEILLREVAGQKAKPYLISQTEAGNVIEKIRTVLDACVTSTKPSYRYFVDLFTNVKRLDQMNNLKSLAIEHYIIRSGKFTVDKATQCTWKSTSMSGNPEQFCVAAVDISNIRNDLVHGNSENEIRWKEDPIPMILEKAEIVVKSCF